MVVNEQLIDKLVDRVLEQMQSSQHFLVEASGRHIHLCRADIDQLFGEGYQLTRDKYLSQPGQFVCKERITVLGPKGALSNVVILGPQRAASQIEVSLTDALALGIKVPVRESGDIAETPGVTLINGKRNVTLSKGLIVAKRHVHVAAKDTAKLGVKQGDVVKVKVGGNGRSLILDDVVIRVSEKFATAMHIDYDEANACGFTKGMHGFIVK